MDTTVYVTYIGRTRTEVVYNGEDFVIKDQPDRVVRLTDELLITFEDSTNVNHFLKMYEIFRLRRMQPVDQLKLGHMISFTLEVQGQGYFDRQVNCMKHVREFNEDNESFYKDAYHNNLYQRAKILYVEHNMRHRISPNYRSIGQP
jgi:hypothetical protein